MGTKQREVGSSSWRLQLLVLVLAGETIFSLPFHVARFFRPSLLLALDISQTELGQLQGAYGLAAMLSYFPGGFVADRVSARLLLPLSLASTALGGLYYATLPAFGGLLLLHIFWGVTTILLFWSAMIRAARLSAPSHGQGRAFGLLEGGRGLVAALLATLGVSLLSSASLQTKAARVDAISSIIVAYCLANLVVAGLVFAALPKENQPGRAARLTAGPPALSLHTLLLRHRLGAQALVVVAAYCVYKGVDFAPSYAVDIFGVSEVQAAGLATAAVWLRPVAAIGAGLLVSHRAASRLARGSFLLLALLFAAGPLLGPNAGALLGLWVLALSSAALGYALRVFYFCLLEESEVPTASTGVAVGFISVLGYTPDVFFPWLSGALIDAPALGYPAFFFALAGFSTMGWLASRRVGTRKKHAG